MKLIDLENKTLYLLLSYAGDNGSIVTDNKYLETINMITFETDNETEISEELFRRIFGPSRTEDNIKEFNSYIKKKEIQLFKLPSIYSAYDDSELDEFQIDYIK